MTLNQAFTCPKCGNKKVQIMNTGSILEDVRLDQFRCPECETQWRVYSKSTEVNSEVTYVAPEAPKEPTKKEETAE